MSRRSSRGANRDSICVAGTAAGAGEERVGGRLGASASGLSSTTSRSMPSMCSMGGLSAVAECALRDVVRRDAAPQSLPHAATPSCRGLAGTPRPWRACLRPLWARPALAGGPRESHPHITPPAPASAARRGVIRGGRRRSGVAAPPTPAPDALSCRGSPPSRKAARGAAGNVTASAPRPCPSRDGAGRSRSLASRPRGRPHLSGAGHALRGPCCPVLHLLAPPYPLVHADSFSLLPSLCSISVGSAH